jgi:REP element-mobilizing transposase RayT
MARPLRIEYPGAVYHVTSRGNARNDIFLDDEDRKSFLSILGAVVGRYQWLCHAYCLMDNHYHLMVETPEGNLSRGMRQINGIYTQLLNRRHSSTGHIFQGRFKAIVVDKDSYLLELCRYVVLNPVRARMVEQPETWTWSSHTATAGLTGKPEFLTVDWILSCFDDKTIEARRHYREFVGDAVPGWSPWDKVSGQVLLGGEGFRVQLEDELAGRRDVREIPRVQCYASRPSLESLLPEGERLGRAGREQRVYEAFTTYGYKLKEIAEHLGVHYATVSKIVKRVEQEKWRGKT